MPYGNISIARRFKMCRVACAFSSQMYYHRHNLNRMPFPEAFYPTGTRIFDSMPLFVGTDRLMFNRVLLPICEARSRRAGFFSLFRELLRVVFAFSRDGKSHGLLLLLEGELAALGRININIML